MHLCAKDNEVTSSLCMTRVSSELDCRLQGTRKRIPFFCKYNMTEILTPELLQLQFQVNPNFKRTGQFRSNSTISVYVFCIVVGNS